MRTKGFCLALLRCGEIKLIAEKREYAISDLIANIARMKRRRTKSFGTQSSFTLLLLLVGVLLVGVLRPARFSENFSSTDTLKSS